MTFSLKKILGTTNTSASIADDHLILSFPQAIEPIVWRMALEKIDTASFEVKKEDGSNNHKLILKPKKGTAEIIATFHNKDEAVEALMTASKGFQRNTYTPDTKGTTAVRANKTEPLPPAPTKKESGKWGFAILGALAVLALYYYMTTLIPVRMTTDEASSNSATNYTAPANPQESTGVPVSADDFLNGL